MRTGWSIKEAGAVLDINPNKIPQALDPAVQKIAKLYDADAVATMEMILERVKELRTERYLAERDAVEMSVGEWKLRKEFNRGLIDLADIGVKPRSR